MTQECQVIKVTEGVYSEVTHSVVENVEKLWEDPCLIRPMDASGQMVILGGEAVRLKLYTGWLPMDAILDGGEFVVWQGVRLSIVDAPLDSWPIGRKGRASGSYMIMSESEGCSVDGCERPKSEGRCARRMPHGSVAGKISRTISEGHWRTDQDQRIKHHRWM